MPAQMHTPCRSLRGAGQPRVKGALWAEAVLERDPGGLFLETHRLVDREHRPVALVVPRLDVIDTQPLRVRHRPKLQRHGDTPAACLPPDAGEALPYERLVPG